MKPLVYGLFILLLFSLMGCSTSSNLIPPSQMADLLNDVALGEAYAETVYLKDSSLNRDSVVQRELDKVFAVNNVKPLQFSTSYAYYTQDPVLFKSIIDSANERIIRKRDQAYTPALPNPQ